MTDKQTLAGELEKQAKPREQTTILDLVERMQPEIGKALGDAIGAERFARIVQTEIRRVPALLDCSPDSVLGAMMLSAQLGLEPGPLGHVYLVPFKNECTWILGYRGMVELAYRSGLLKAIAAQTVYEGDEFSFRLGSRPVLDHTPSGPPAERTPTHWYAVAELKTGGKPFVVLYPEDVAKAKAHSAAGRKGSGPWATDFDAMARKTAVRRLAKLLPQSPQLARGLARDEQPAPEFDHEGELVDVEGSNGSGE